MLKNAQALRAKTHISALLAFVALLCCLLLPQPARAAEEIVSFHADIQVLPDGALEVIETIDYRLGDAANIWGMYRAIPLTVRSATGELSPVTFNLRSVKRGGQATVHKLYRRDDMAEVRIGDPDVFLPANSLQTYEIRYRSRGNIQFFEQHDRLYWNVTGSNWPFSILAASVSVSFPENVPIEQLTVYKGHEGTRSSDFEVIEVSDRVYQANTTAPLQPGERFAIAFLWPKGAITVGAPPLLSRLPPERLALFVPPLVTASVLFIFWLAVGRDPKRAPLRREFEPPEGMGPAAVRFLYHRYFDFRCFTAALLSMAAKGTLRIVEEDAVDGSSKPRFRLEPLETDGQVLTPTEQAAYAALFPTNECRQLGHDSADEEHNSQAEAVLERQLSEERGGTPYLRNASYTAAGGVIGLISWLLVPLIAPSYDLTHNASVQWLIAAGGFGIVTFFFTAAWFMPTIQQVSFKEFLLFLCIALPLSTIVLAIAYGFILARQDDYASQLDLFLLASGALFGFFIVLFHELLIAPTKEERILLDRIEGLCLYLHGATPKGLDYRSAPKPTPELFERLLPYAVALEFVDDWSAQFDRVIGRDYRPAWYSGDRFDAVEFIDRFTDAVIAIPTDPSKRERNRIFFRLGARLGRWM